MASPVFVSFEGGEGSGKSTQANLLRDALVEAGLPTVLVHEPGSTHFGNYLRQYLKDEHQPLSKEAELLLFTAARAQLVAEVIRPALDSGTSVVADRYADSTVAYQGFGQGLNRDTISLLNSVATEGVIPHITFLLDIDPARALREVGPQLSLSLDIEGPEPKVEGQGRFENMSLEFHRRVRRGYLELAKQDPDRWVVLNATLPREEIAAQVWQRVSTLLQ